MQKTLHWLDVASDWVAGLSLISFLAWYQWAVVIKLSLTLALSGGSQC